MDPMPASLRIGVLYAALGLQMVAAPSHKSSHRKTVHKPNAPLSTEAIKAVDDYMGTRHAAPESCLEKASHSSGAAGVGFAVDDGGRLSCRITRDTVRMNLFNEDRTQHVALEYQRSAGSVDISTLRQDGSRTGHYSGNPTELKEAERLRYVVQAMQGAPLFSPLP